MSKPAFPITVRLALFTLVLSVPFLGACNDVSGPVGDRLSQDPRNSTMEIDASYAGLFDHSVLVLEVAEPVTTAAPVDLFRAVLQAADTLQDRTFSEVHLVSPSAGHVYTVDGTYFKTLGQEYDFQNPVFTMRTFPYEIRRPDGAPAFMNSGGGLFGLGDQFEDFKDAMVAWGT